jgi:hypothetical protein
MVYLPASNAKEAVFSLKDEAGNMQHQMTIPVAGKSGVIAVKLTNVSWTTKSSIYEYSRKCY